MTWHWLAPYSISPVKGPHTPSRKASIGIKKHHKRKISTILLRCRSRIVKLRVRES
jgi:hypothetical protein